MNGIDAAPVDTEQPELEATRGRAQHQRLMDHARRDEPLDVPQVVGDVCERMTISSSQAVLDRMMRERYRGVPPSSTERVN